MRLFAEILALTALVSAQDISFEEIPDAPTPSIPLGEGVKSTIIPLNPTPVIQNTVASILANPDSNVIISGTNTASTSQKRGQDSDLEKRDSWDCSSMDAGAGEVPSPDDPNTFVNWPAFADKATNAPTPQGWQRTFVNLQGESQISGYMGYTTLQSYDTQKCADSCSAITGCMSFNIAFERTPTQVPADSCPNPPSSTVIKCVFWGNPVTAATATNTGQWRNQFQVVVAGSNGYTKALTAGNPATDYPLSGYSGITLNDASINAPVDCNNRDTYIQYSAFTGTQFDPNFCATACEAVTQFNIDHLGGRSICRFFVTYTLEKNNVPQGQICAMYNTTWPGLTYASNTGYTNGNDQYTISNSFAYFNTTDPGSPVCPADIAYLESSEANKDFCTSYINYAQPTTTVSIVSTVSTVTTTTSTSTFVSIPDASVFTVDVTSVAVTTSVVPVTSTVTITTIIYPTVSPAPAKRVVAPSTPSSIATWPASKISLACSQVATDTATSTIVATTATVYTSTSVIVSTVTSVAAVPVVTSTSVEVDYATTVVTSVTTATVAVLDPVVCFQLQDTGSGHYLVAAANTGSWVDATLGASSSAIVLKHLPGGIVEVAGGSPNVYYYILDFDSLHTTGWLGFHVSLYASFRFLCQPTVSSFTCQYNQQSQRFWFSTSSGQVLVNPTAVGDYELTFQPVAVTCPAPP